MKVITLHQPWATLVVTGLKKIETRSWKTSHRGKILIHASQNRVEGFDLFYRHVSDMRALQAGIPTIWNHLPFGEIIGQVEIVDCLSAESCANYGQPSDIAREKLFGDFSSGRYGWILKNPFMWPKGIEAKGLQRIWNYDGPIWEAQK